jgi:hypothetical protein
MNDLDLRTALHRDADLVGSPSPDLLDQLVQRRQHQRRQRAGVLSAVAAVVVIAAGIPVGQSLLTRADGGPAGETTVAPTPSVTPEVAVTPSVTPDVLPTPTAAAPGTAEVPVSSVPPPAEVTLACPDLATLRDVLPADTATKTITMFAANGVKCSGDWAGASYSEATFGDGEWWSNGQVGLFHYVDGSWTQISRDHCDDPGIPDAVWDGVCNVD